MQESIAFCTENCWFSCAKNYVFVHGEEKRMTELILFDIGAVQLRLNYGAFFEQTQKFAVDPVRFKQEYPRLEAEYFKRNEPAAPQEFMAQIKTLLSREHLSDTSIKELLRSAWGNPIDEILAIKSKVKEAYTVGNFSNITALQLEMLFETFPKIVEGCADYPSLYSCRSGATKADPEIYGQIQGYHPIIFIDDNEMYVKNAIAAGWKGIWLTSYIDQSEAMRLAHTATSAAPAAELKVANSVQGLEQALRECGIKI